MARRAEIKVSCISNILPSVLLCRSLKPNGKYSGKMGSTKTENESLSGFVINSAKSSSKKIIGNVTAKNYLKESLSSILCFIIQGKGSSWKRFFPEIYFVAILRIFDMTVKYILARQILHFI